MHGRPGREVRIGLIPLMKVIYSVDALTMENLDIVAEIQSRETCFLIHSSFKFYANMTESRVS